MAKVLLLNPPSGFLIDQRVFLPLGLASLAAFATQQGNDITLIDLSDDKNYDQTVSNAVLRGNYDAVGISATSPQFHYTYNLLHQIRTTKPGTKVIIGGAHASMLSSLRNTLKERFSKGGLNGVALDQRVREEDVNFLRLEEFDVVAAGEERSLNMALNSSEQWVDAGISQDLDDLPLPSRGLFDVKNYLLDADGRPKFPINGKPSGSIISQRGCPYGCEFCCGRDSEMYRRLKLPDGRLRTKSPKRVIEELDEMKKSYGLESFMFYDDEFNLNSGRTIELCRLLSQRNYSYRGFVKSNLLVKNPEVARAMKEVGFVEVLSGIETGSERILQHHLHKGSNPEANYRAAMICLECGLDFKALTMLGHVSETEVDILATRDWIVRTGNQFRNRVGPGHFTFDLTLFQPYAGSPIWDRAERNTGDFSDEFAWVYNTRRQGVVVDPEQGGLYFNKPDFSTEEGFYKGKPGNYKSFIRTKKISPEKFVRLRDEIEWEIRDKLQMQQLSQTASQTQYEHSMGQ